MNHLTILLAPILCVGLASCTDVESPGAGSTSHRGSGPHTEIKEVARNIVVRGRSFSSLQIESRHFINENGSRYECSDTYFVTDQSEQLRLFSHAYGGSAVCLWASSIVFYPDLNGDGNTDFIIRDEDDVHYVYTAYVSEGASYASYDLLAILKAALQTELDVGDLNVAGYTTPTFSEESNTITFTVTEGYNTDQPAPRSHQLRYMVEAGEWVLVN